MIRRLRLLGLLVIVAMLLVPTAAPAQATRKVVEITMTSFKFEPNLIRFQEGDTVVLRLINADQSGRAHDLAAAYLLDIPLTIRGDGRESVSEGRKRIFVDAGKRAEVEFVAKGRGSFAYICSLFAHAAQGMTGAFIVGPASSP
ncbi:MAG: cupredoxin domain-containing protein [bacterium]|nr:cupredoxin domain-containing protein [bacterium]